MACALLVAVSAAAAVAAPGGFEGSYRATLAARALVAVGTPADLAAADTGTWTLTVRGGRWWLRQSGGPYGNASDRGDVAVAGAVAKFETRTVDGYPHHVFVGALRWRLRAGVLRFAIVGRQREDLAGVLAAAGWQPTS
jgi:hypothetical protein